MTWLRDNNTNLNSKTDDEPECLDIIENITSTPFARWRENKEIDPHGNRFSQGLGNLTYGDIPCEVIAIALIKRTSEFSFITWLTAGKERLRWLSRKLYELTSEHKNINRRRSELAQGDLTDDELANEFYLSESREDLQAGHDRIKWLLYEIKQLNNEKT